MEAVRSPAGAMKTCPRCAEEIKLEARVCRYCHASFALERHGYCSACHRVVVPDADSDLCPSCGGQLVDVVVDSRLVAPGPSSRETVPSPTTGTALSPPQGWAQVPPPGDAATPGATGDAGAALAGPVRRAIVPTLRQFVGVNLASAAALVLFFMPLLGFFDGLRIAERSSGGVVVEYVVAGPIFFVFAVAVALAMPRRVFPRRVSGSWLKAKAATVPFLADLRQTLGVRALYKHGGFVVRIVVLALLWVGAAVVFPSVASTPGWDPRGGVPVTWAAIVLGAIGTALMIPGRHRRTVLVDDAGHFTEEPLAPLDR